MRFISVTILSSFIFVTTSFTQNYWTQIAQLPSTVECFANGTGSTLFAGTLGSGVYISNNGGDNWTQLNNGLTDPRVYSIVWGQTGLFAGTDSSGVFRSTDNGNYWIHTSLTTHFKVKALAIGTDSSVYAASFGDGLYKSTNNGANWSHYLLNDSLEALAVHPGGNIFLGCWKPNAMLRSTDRGVTWSIADTEAHAFNTIKISPYNNDVYGITGALITDNLIGDVIVRSTDAGNTWTVPYSFATSSFGMAINSIGHIFVGRYIGAWESADNGANWVIHNSGINTSNGLLLCYCINSGQYILAGQEGGTIYRSIESTIGVRKIGSVVPKEYSLYQNYPNPFNPTTKIEFEIPLSPLNERSTTRLVEGVGGLITLKIYDILGREITVFVNDRLEPGSYEIEWDGSNYPSGIYFYQLTANSFRESRRMVLVK